MNDDIKPWDILRKAAHLIETGDELFCFTAIDNVAEKALHRQFWKSPVYAAVMSSFCKISRGDVDHPFADQWLDYAAQSHSERVLGLLFAAEIAKDEWK